MVAKGFCHDHGSASYCLPIAAQLDSQLGLRWTDITLVWQDPTEEIQRMVEQGDLMESLQVSLHQTTHSQPVWQAQRARELV